jgi:hypothetical protein
MVQVGVVYVICKEENGKLLIYVLMDGLKMKSCVRGCGFPVNVNLKITFQFLILRATLRLGELPLHSTEKKSQKIVQFSFFSISF